MPQLAQNTNLKWPAEVNVVKAGRKRKNRRATPSRRCKADPTAGLQVANPNAAAIDIGAAEHWVSVPASRDSQPTQRFGCGTVELRRLADWLQACAVATGVLEATGNYWVAL